MLLALFPPDRHGRGIKVKKEKIGAKQVHGLHGSRGGGVGARQVVDLSGLFVFVSPNLIEANISNGQWLRPLG